MSAPQLTVSQRFFFEAAHTLHREVEAEGSRRIHGHTYHAEVAVRGPVDARTGMVVDLGALRGALQRVRLQLDHQLLDEVPGLGIPTLENLCLFIAKALGSMRPPPTRVRVWRDASGDECMLEPGA